MVYGNSRRKMETPDISLDDVPLKLKVAKKLNYLGVANL